MKRMFFTVVFLLAALSVFGQSNNGTLDGAIQNAARQIQDGLPKGSTIVVYQFQSHNPRLSDYVLKELFDKLVNSRKLFVLDRGAQEVIDAEIEFSSRKARV